MKQTFSLLFEILTYLLAAIGAIAVRNWATAKIEAWESRQEERYQKRLANLRRAHDEIMEGEEE